jgi:hypothetical protein
MPEMETARALDLVVRQKPAQPRFGVRRLPEVDEPDMQLVALRGAIRRHAGRKPDRAHQWRHAAAGMTDTIAAARPPANGGHLARRAAFR